MYYVKFFAPIKMWAHNLPSKAILTEFSLLRNANTGTYIVIKYRCDYLTNNHNK